MIKVSSSNIEGVDYDYKNSKLYVKFLSGNIYEYNDVPYQVFLALINSNSAGKYFNNFVRDSYDFKKVDNIPDIERELRPGEIKVKATHLQDEGKIRVELEGGEFLIPAGNSPGEDVQIPYWVLLKVTGSPALIRSLQDAFGSKGCVQSSEFAWDGKSLRVFTGSLPDNPETEEERERERRRLERKKVAMRAFGVPVD